MIEVSADWAVSCRDDLVALQHDTGARLEDLVVLSGDPFLTGTPADWRKANWLVEQVHAFNLLGQHQRGLHYGLVSNNGKLPDGRIYTGTKKDVRFLNEAVTAARELGLIARDAFPDRKSKLIEDATGLRDPEWAEVHVSPPDAAIPSLAYEAASWPEGLTLSRPASLQVQPLVVEIITEKDGIVPQLRPAAHRHGCRLTVTTGFTGKSLAAEILGRAIRDDRPRVILSFHDADAAGESMPIATGRHLEFLIRQAEAEGEELPAIYLDAVALTLEQVEAIEHSTGRKIPLSPDVAREQGRVELDALPHFAPGWIEAELERRLSALRCHVDFTPLDDAEEEAEEGIDGAFADVRMRLDRLTEKANALLQIPAAQALQEQLDELNAELVTVRREAREIADTLVIDVPDPDVDEPDFDRIDWLFASPRDYIEQLNAYRRREPIHRRRPHINLTERDPCPTCGSDLRGRKSGARFCSDLCRSAWNRQP